MEKQMKLKLNADISNMQRELKKMANGVKKYSADARESLEDNFEKGSKEAKDELSEVGNKAKSMGGLFKKVFGAIGLSLAGVGIGQFAVDVAETSAELQALNSQFKQTFGKLEKEATSTMKKISKETGMAEGRLKGSYTKITAFAKTTGMETKEAMELSERAIRVAADSSAYYDRTLEETTESLQSFLKGK